MIIEPAAPKEAPVTQPKSERRTYVVDSVANTVRSLAVALAVLITNPWIIRTLGEERYSIWVLALSIGAYVPFAESGIGTSVVRYVAPDGSGTSSETRSFLANAFVFASLAGLVVVTIVGGLVAGTTLLFGKAPAVSHADLRVASALCIGAGFLGLWSSVANGYFSARHQTSTSASISIAITVVNVSGVIFACQRFGTAIALGVVTAAVATLQAGSLGWTVIRRSGLRLSDVRIRRDKLRAIFSHCLGTGWWSLAALLITGLDLVIVARVDFPHVGAYAIAARLVLLVLTLVGAATAPIMAVAARAAASGDSERVSVLLLRSSRLVNCGNAVLTCGLFVSAPLVIRLFAGSAYVDAASTILRILLIGNFIRQTGGILGVVMVATGEHRKAFLPPIIEGLVNAGVSIGLGAAIGANGVAVGTAVGAAVTIVLYNVLVFARFEAFSLRSRDFFLTCVGPAVLVLSPAFVALPFAQSSGLFSSALITSAALSASLALGWRFGLTSEDRTQIRHFTTPRRNTR